MQTLNRVKVIFGRDIDVLIIQVLKASALLAGPKYSFDPLTGIGCFTLDNLVTSLDLGLYVSNQTY